MDRYVARGLFDNTFISGVLQKDVSLPFHLCNGAHIVLSINHSLADTFKETGSAEPIDKYYRDCIMSVDISDSFAV